MTPRRRFITALTGTVAVALCCFTPVLVVALTAIGLGAVTRYLDIVLLPALAALLIVTVLSYRRYALARRTERRVAEGGGTH